mmetsp:Transcript_10959/g.16578  ORF Transcript_10959/g.16578 Transcript_10959/m.16578 type:complete len:94 (+) Transcript_10959:57-338(+)
MMRRIVTTTSSRCRVRPAAVSRRGTSKAAPPPKKDESHLNWKDRKEAPPFLKKMAPPTGGRWPPRPHEAAFIGAAVAVFSYACLADGSGGSDK